MPWNMNDYPTSMKNLAPLIRKKAIDIGNALLVDGYPDDRAISIAISQAEKWYQEASAADKKAFEQEANPTKQDSHKQDKHAGKLLTAAVNVKYKDGQWLVISDSAEKASNTFTHKQEAVERAQEIARNKQTKLKIYKQDGTLQETKEYTE